MTEVRGPFSDVMGKRRLWVRLLLLNQPVSCHYLPLAS
jgi:hypothetical protein